MAEVWHQVVAAEIDLGPIPVEGEDLSVLAEGMWRPITAKDEHQAIVVDVNLRPIPVEDAPILEHTLVFWWLLWPKTQLCMVVDYTGTNKKSLLLHQKGTRILGGQSKTEILSNITILILHSQAIF